MRLFVLVATWAVMICAAQAAPVSVQNGNFEDPYELTSGSTLGLWEFGAAGWVAGGNGSAGTWEFPGSVFGPGIPAETGDRIGFVNADSSLSQSLGILIEEDTDYSFSALFGNRVDIIGFTGSFGFYAGDPSNIIGDLQTILNPGDGVFSLQTISFMSSLFNQFIGQELGIIIISEFGQINFDFVSVEMAQLNLQNSVVETPLPAAIWLFGSALFAGGFVTRRKSAA